MRYYLIAGEASGDLHGSRLIRQLRTFDSEAVFRGWGGHRMEAEGMYLVKHYKDLAFMGFWEVATHIFAIMHNFSLARQDIVQFNPDVVILIDYPGFNLRLARFLKKKHFRVFYYISPQVWAWKESRVHTIARYVDKMLVILPFEQEFYAAKGIKVDFVGHPLPDILDEVVKDPYFLQKHQFNPEQKIIALLPGSRKQEIAHMLPVMTEVSRQFPNYQFAVAGLGYLGAAYYRPFLAGTSVQLVIDDTHNLLLHAHAALVTSGTATLETALLNVPQVVCYKGNYLSYTIGRLLVNVPYISLVNLILQKKVVDEVIQDQCTIAHVAASLRNILDETTRSEILHEYRQLREKLAGKNASQKAAKLIYTYLTDKQIC